MHTRESLKNDLEKMGLDPAGTVMIHSSMRAIGDVEDRAEGVLDAICSYFADGLVCFPTLSWDLVDARQPVFSVRDTPATTGILPELFRRRSGVRRSLSPTHSIAAMGGDAAAFTAGHEKCDSPAPPGSPWSRLYDRNAKILFIGCSPQSNTYLHGVEEWLPVPGMLTESRQDLVIYDEDGKRIECPMRRHVGHHSQFYDLIIPALRDAGGWAEGTFGNARVQILDARSAGDITMAILKEHPQFFTPEFQAEHGGKN